MAGVFELGALAQSRSSRDARQTNCIATFLGGSRGGFYGLNHIYIVKCVLRIIRLRDSHYLQHSFCHQVIGVPCKSHASSRVAIDVGYYIVRILICFELSNLIVHCNEVLLSRIIACSFFGNQELDKRRNGIVLDLVVGVSCSYIDEIARLACDAACEQN